MQRRVLIIEDSKDDFAAILRALGSNCVNANIAHSWNGDDALEEMRELVTAGKIGRLPQVILLDLNLPGTDGREILMEIKADELLKAIPVVVLTTSTNPRDVVECYGKGASGYCVKGSDRSSFAETITAFKRFWLQAAVLPTRADAN